MQINRKEVTRAIQSHARAALHHANSLSTIQRIYAGLFLAITAVFTTVFVLYHSTIFSFIESIKAELIESSWKWLLLVALTAACSFPPLIGYASSVTLAGYVFGFFKGWAIALLGSLCGAGFAFLVYRYALAKYATRMSAQNRHFMALTKALDGAQGWTLLVMIRLCPFPFSLSNAALSTIPSITFVKFMGATFLGGVRLSVHAFVGSRLADFTDNPNADKKSRIVSTIGIIGGLAIGAATGYAVYVRTKMIANRLSAEREGESQFSSDQILPDEDDDLSPTRSRESDSLLR